MLLSIIVPVFNEQDNLTVAYRKLRQVADGVLPVETELIFIDDCSSDQSYSILAELAGQDKRIKIIRFSKNFGSHIAYVAGLTYCRGDAAVLISADMQEPPEIIPEFVRHWQDGCKVVLGIREERDESKTKIFLAGVYHYLMRHIALDNYPVKGSDIFLIDRKVIEVITGTKEKNTTIFGLICWSGFAQVCIPYKRASRQWGTSKWTLSKQIKLAIDSMIAFSYVPLRLSSYAGLTISLLGFIYSCVIIFNGIFRDRQVEGWTSLMVVILIVSGIQLLILGILGEYLWRNLEETRKRPLFIIDKKIGWE